MEDAIYLAYFIDKHCKQNYDIDSVTDAFCAYEAARKQRTISIQKISQRIGMMRQLSCKPLMWLRDWVFKMMPQFIVLNVTKTILQPEIPQLGGSNF